MGSHDFAKVLKLWIELDRLLASKRGVNVPEFAHEYGVSLPTAYRYLDLLVAQVGCGGTYSIEGRKRLWRYDGAGPLFTVNVGRPETDE